MIFYLRNGRIVLYNDINKKAYILDTKSSIVFKSIGDNEKQSAYAKKLLDLKIEKTKQISERARFFNVKLNGITNGNKYYLSILYTIYMISHFIIFLSNLLYGNESYTIFKNCLKHGLEISAIIKVLIIIIVILISMVFHELAHIFGAKLHGAIVPEFGVKFALLNKKIYIKPYTIIIGKEFLSSYQQLDYLLAGIVFHFWLANLSFLALSLINNTIGLYICLSVFCCNFIFSILNLIPIGQSDGRKALNIQFKVKNIRDD
ncbi:MAG: M50 family metallopeptidase [Tissierellia bacterium]|nr:M50 family metallopeptidase [Tissierellia bacterium]